MTKRTYQPNKRKRSTTHGFLVRMARKKTGKVPSVISKRRHKGRKLLAPARKKK